MSTSIKGAAQRVLAGLTMVATVLSLVGFAAMPIAAQAVAPADYGLREGDTISASGSNDPDIYIVNDWGYKRLFVNPAIFTLYGHLSWAGVKSVSPATRDAFGTSGLFRNCETGDQKVYGLDVLSEDVANLRWVNTSGAQAVLDDPMFFRKVFCINSREQALYGTGADYTSVLQVPAYSRGGLPVGTGAVSASLSSDNPASNTLIETQSAADLAHFTFSGSGTVTSVVLQRLGVSSDVTLSNVYLYQGTKRLTDAATVSSGKITFSDTAGLFTVNGSANIAVKADVADGTSGQTLGVQLTSFNGNAVSLSGNLFTIATNPTDLATIAVGAPTPLTLASINPQNDYPIWTSIVTIGNHEVSLRSLQVRVIGSVVAGDLRNFRLYKDGVQIGSSIAQQDANGYVVFDFGSGITLATGGRTLKLLADIVGGSGKNFFISLRNKADISAYDTQYGVGLLDSTGVYPASAPTQTLGDGTEVLSIGAGTLTITKTTDSASGDVIKDATGVSLVKYTFTANGEALKVESLKANFTAGGTAVASLMSLRNGAIYVDGAQVGSVQSLCEDSAALAASCSASTLVASPNSSTLFNLGSSLVIQPGTPRTVEIRADIYDNTGTNNATAGQTITAQFIAGTSNVQKMVSLGYLGNSAATVGSALTIKTGSFNAAKYTGYANQSAVVPRSQFKIGHYTLSAASSEDINVNTITIDTASISLNELQDMYIVVKNDAGSTVYTSAAKATITASTTSSNSFSVTLTIPKTKVWQIEVYANLLTKLGTPLDTFSTNMDAAGTTANSATAVSAVAATGQSITAIAGSLVLANSGSPAAAVVNGGVTKTAYVFTLQPQYDDFYLDEASFNLLSVVASSTGAISMAHLYAGDVLVGSSPITSTTSGAMDFSGLNFSIPQGGGTKTFSVKVDLSNVGVGGNDTAGSVTVRLSHLKYRNSSGTITTSTVAPTSYTGNEAVVVKAYPTFSNVALPSTVLANGTKTLFKTNVTAVGGTLVYRKVVFTVSVTATPTLTAFKLFENGVDISSLASGTLLNNSALRQYATNSNDFNIAGVDGDGTVVFVFNTDRPISGTTTLELRATVGGTNTAGNSISTSIDNPNSSTFVPSNTVILLGGLPAVTWRTDENPSFLWSDQSEPTHSATTNDWMGDGMLTGLGEAQSLSM